MMEIPEHIEDLITRVLADIASEEEKLELETWRELKRENEQYFQDMEFLFFASASVKQTIPVDLNSAWLKVKAKSITSKRYFLYRIPLRVAAALMILALCSIGVYLFIREDEVQNNFELYASEEMHEVLLPDSTTISLSKGSKITALSNENEYAYSLIGEANFVIHKSDKPFVLYAKELAIRDIGTEFSVSAIENQDTVWINVNEGIVLLKSPNGDSTSLSERQSAYYLSSTQKLYQPEKILPVMRASFSFDAVPLSQAIALLSDHFGKRIELENSKLADCQISVNFESESLNTILEVICLTLNLDLESNDDYYIILGTACTADS